MHIRIATLEPVSGRISLYSSLLRSSEDAEPKYRGVSLQLLQYIVLSSVLLVAPFDEWRAVPNTPDFDFAPTTPLSPLRTSSDSVPSSPVKHTFATQALATYSSEKLDLLCSSSTSSSPTSSGPSTPRTPIGATSIPTSFQLPPSPSSHTFSELELDAYSCSKAPSLWKEARRRSSMKQLRPALPDVIAEPLPVRPSTATTTSIPTIMQPVPPSARRQQTAERRHRSLIPTEPPPSYWEIDTPAATSLTLPPLPRRHSS